MVESRRCLVVDPDPLTRLAVSNLLDGEYEVEPFCGRREAVDAVRDVGGYTVAVIDFCTRAEEDGEVSGVEAVRAIRNSEPALGIVAHGRRPARHLAAAALDAGATAYVSRLAEPDQLRAAIRRAAEQEPFLDPAVRAKKGSRGTLTRRQREILELLADGRSTVYAAGCLGLGEETVKTHTRHMLTRLGARNRAHAVAIAVRRGLIE